MLTTLPTVILNFLFFVWVVNPQPAAAATPVVSLSGPSVGSYATFEGVSSNFMSLLRAEAAVTLIDGSSGVVLLQPAGGAYIPSAIMTVELEPGSNTLYVELTTNQYTAAMFYAWGPSYVPPSSCDPASLPAHVFCSEIPYADSCSASANYVSDTPYANNTSGFPCASFTRTYIFSNLVVGLNELFVVLYNLNDNLTTEPILLTSYSIRCYVVSAGTLPTVAPPSSPVVYAPPNITTVASINLALSYWLPLSFSFSHCYVQQFTCSLSQLTSSSSLVPLVTALFSPPTCSSSSPPTLSVSLNLGAAYYDTFINGEAIASLSKTSNSRWDAFLFGANASALQSTGATIVIGCTFQNVAPTAVNATTNIVVQSSTISLNANFVSLSVSFSTKTSSTVKFGMSSSAFPSLKRSSRWVSSSVVMSTASLSSLIAELLPWIGMIGMNIAAESVTDNSNGSQTITLAFFGTEASVMKSLFILESQLTSNLYSSFTYSSQLNPNVAPTYSFDNFCLSSSSSCGTVLTSVPSPSANAATPGNYPYPSSSSATSSSSSSMSASTIAAIVVPLLLVALLVAILVFWIVWRLRRNHASAVGAGSSSVIALHQHRTVAVSMQPQQRAAVPYGVMLEEEEPVSTMIQRREGDSTVIAVLPAYTSSDSSTLAMSTAFTHTTGDEDSRMEGQPANPLPPPYIQDPQQAAAPFSASSSSSSSSSSSAAVPAAVTPVGGATAFVETSVVARPSKVSVSRSHAHSQAPLMGGAGGRRNDDEDGEELSISRSTLNY